MRITLIFIVLLASITLADEAYGCEFMSDKRIVSSVSPEFINGLQAKFLKFFADELGCELEILPMPMSRRVMSLRNGQIDIMVGLKAQYEENDDFVYLLPSYELVSSRYFAHVDSVIDWHSQNRKLPYMLGTTLDLNYQALSLDPNSFHIVPVTTLHQKVDMLQKGRLDLFVHYEQSAKAYLEKHGLQEQVVMQSHSPDLDINYYVGVSTQSSLFAHRKLLEAIIISAKKQGVFEKMRREHYLNQTPINASPD